MGKNKLCYLQLIAFLLVPTSSVLGQTRVTVGTMKNSAIFGKDGNLFINMEDGKVKLTGSNSKARNEYSYASMPMTERAVMRLDLTQKHTNNDVDDKVQVTPTLNYKDKYYTTLYAPYNLVVPPPSDCSVYIPEYEDDHTIRVGSKQLCTEGTVIPIGTGLIVISTKPATIGFEISTDKPDNMPSSGLTGTSVSTPVYHFAPDAIYALSIKDSKIGFHHFVSTHTVPCKAFLTTNYIKKESDAKQIEIIFDDFTTSIQSPIANDKDCRTYNTLGQQVSENAHGIVIRNGKKYVNE